MAQREQTGEAASRKGGKSLLAVKVAICFMACINYLDYVITPCVTNIYSSLNVTDTFQQSFIAAGSTIMAIPFMLLCGKLAQYVSKKTILLWACIITSVGNVIITFSPTAVTFCIGRALQGCGMGVGVVLANSLMIEQITDERELGNFMGVFQGIGAFYAVILSTAAGFLAAAYSWRFASVLNWLVIVEFFVTLALLPKTPPEGKAAAEAGTEADGSSKETSGAFRKLLRILILSVLYMSFATVLYYYIDVLVTENGLGDSSLSGLIISVYMISNTICCVTFGPVYSRLGNKMEPLVFATATIAYLLLLLPISAQTMFVSVIFMGMSAAWMICYYPLLIGTFSPADKMTIYQSGYVVMCYLGMYICSFVPFWLEGALGVSLMKDTFPVNVAVLAACFVVVLLRSLRDRASEASAG